MSEFLIIIIAACCCLTIFVVAGLVTEYFWYSNKLASYSAAFNSLRNLQQDALAHDLDRQAILSWLRSDLEALAKLQEKKSHDKQNILGIE